MQREGEEREGETSGSCEISLIPVPISGAPILLYCLWGQGNERVESAARD